MGKMVSCDPVSSDVIVDVKGKTGSTFTGVMVNHKTVKSQYKNSDGGEKFFDIYTFKVVDGDMALLKKDTNKEYQPADVTENSEVNVFPPSRLAAGLKQVEMGSTVKITYLGLGKKGAKGGNKPHTYSLEIL